jgi:hypothetical protein
MMKRPAGVPKSYWDHLMDRLRTGRADAFEQRELHKILDHKYGGRPGAVKLTCVDSARHLVAAVLATEVRWEILRMQQAGDPAPPGGYRAVALNVVARRHNRGKGETLGIWLHRNRLSRR